MKHLLFYLHSHGFLISLIDGIRKYALGADFRYPLCGDGQSFKPLVGGELKSYNGMMREGRAIAAKRMVEEAEALGADAIVNIRYVSSAIMQDAAEVIAYGTAVKFVK